jgi:hypothetical protein
MRATRETMALSIALGAILLLGWEGGASEARALGHVQPLVPTSTRPAPPPLPAPTSPPQPPSPKPRSPTLPAPSPTPAPVLPATPGLPEAGGRTGAVIGWPGVLVGGGAALAVGLALRRTGSGKQEPG